MSPSGDTAYVLFHYTCQVPSHLYVAVKQGATISPTNTSSSGAVTYYSTNWSIDSGPNALTCDGKRHVKRAVLKLEDGFSRASVQQALVQICVVGYDNTLNLDYSMKRVVAPHGS